MLKQDSTTAPALRDMRFSDLGLDSKKKPLLATAPTTTISDALQMMADHGVLTICLTSSSFPSSSLPRAVLSVLDLLARVGRNPDNLFSTLDAATTLDSEQESYRLHERDRNDRLGDILPQFASRGGCHRVIVSDVIGGRPPVMVSQGDVIRLIAARTESVADLSRVSVKKFCIGSQKIVSVGGNESLATAMKIMVDNGISGLLVVDDEGRAADSLSVDDLRGALGETSDFDLSVAAFVKRTGARHCNETEAALSADATVADVVHTMVKEDAHRVWVLDENKRGVGVITQGDVIGVVVAQNCS